jgi:hypothetical protein
MGIEPTSEAWEASILPLYDARSSLDYADYTHLRASRYSVVDLQPFAHFPILFGSTPPEPRVSVVPPRLRIYS